VREKTPGALVTGKMLAPDLGYIRIATFGADATKIRAQAETLTKSGASSSSSISGTPPRGRSRPV
jgi:hypothetical protein